MRRLLLVFLSTILLIPAGLTATAAAQAESSVQSCPFQDSWTWYPTTIFESGQCFWTPNAILYMQADGNLVLMDGHGAVVWDSKTHGHWGARAIFQSDGNFVIEWWPNGPVLWETHTWGHPNAFMRLTAEGRLFIKEGKRFLWRKP